MPNASYSDVRERMQSLHSRGLKILAESKIPVSKSGAHEERIHDWARDAEEVLHLVDHVLPDVLSDFRDLGKQFVFQVDRSKSPPSNAAFHPRFVNPETGKKEAAPILLDFRFDLMRQANALLRFADQKLKMLGALSQNAGINQTLGERLRAARVRSGDRQEDVAEKLGENIDHKYVSEWERGLRHPKKHLSAVLAYIEQASKKSPLTKGPQKTTQQ